jgi:hypothetical protein
MRDPLFRKYLQVCLGAKAPPPPQDLYTVSPRSLSAFPFTWWIAFFNVPSLEQEHNSSMCQYSHTKNSAVSSLKGHSSIIPHFFTHSTLQSHAATHTVPKTEDLFSVVHRLHIFCFLPLKTPTFQKGDGKETNSDIKMLSLPLRCLKITFLVQRIRQLPSLSTNTLSFVCKTLST